MQEAKTKLGVAEYKEKMYISGWPKARIEVYNVQTNSFSFLD
jgi:hypothetical protein